MERHYVTVGDRQVHYTSAGQGLPIVLLHASPGDYRPLRGLVEELARWFTVYALDTPGHGGSDPLPVAEPAMADYGAALGETLTALGLERVHLYGTHTGAKVALAFAVAQPGRVASLVLDGLGISTPEERADQLANYLPPIARRGDGTHLVEAWHRVRNMYLFWPWYNERPEARLASAMPSPGYLHEVTTGMLETGGTYSLAYRAAFVCDPAPLLARLAVPSLLFASPGDPLHAHLDRLPDLGTRIRVEDLAAGSDSPQGVAARVRSHAAAHPEGVTGAPARPEVRAAGTLTRRYVSTRLGQVLVRWTGTGTAGRPLVALPPAPASGHAVDGLLSRAGEHRPAFAVDLPGTGDSDLRGKLTVDAGQLAEAVRDVLEELGLGTVDLYGSGAGGTIAAAVAERHPARVHALALAALPDPERLPAELASARTPSLTPDDHGTHLLRAWHLVRDGGLRPGTSPPSTGGDGGRPDLAVLERRVLDIVKAWPTYGSVFRAAVLDGVVRRLAALRTPIVAADPIWDPFVADAEFTPSHSPHDGRGGQAALLKALDEAGT
ncbi:alpha/beta fold hydrolase [Streptosporangium amethystogenes]|uniref:alpha/beta fold hydrolase n=1 Tax=Streptosporangium amethystogenes TaxID=2002 RepID=UPI00068FC88E|nr:alpha/beta hydrolase [Streptosporangium amethystogenes]